MPRSPLAPRLSATHAAFVRARPVGAEEDVHMLPEVVDHIIDRCSRPGELVFDPFAGFGTTLHRALAHGRRALGIELLPERVALVRQRCPQARVIEGDARELLRLVVSVLPIPGASVDLVLASPPYMTATDQDADPLTAYERDGGDYDRYLDELGLVAAQCAYLLKPGGFLVWNVADIVSEGSRTALIDDCARVLARHLTVVGVTPIEWDHLPHDLVADALVVCCRA